ncbi:hypothetical protein CR513_35753, partial [Mucuna pruriens]
MTRSGRIFALEALKNKDPAPAKKEKIVESPKRMVTKEEAQEFLKSEYEMLDQLHKTPTRIFFLSLLINSKSHRELLLKVLNKVHVPQDITPAKFEAIINNITVSHHLSFSEEEVLVEGKNHNRPLHIAVKCRNYMIARIMGPHSTSCQKITLDKLYSPGAILRNSLVVVRAFDGSKWEVMSEITLLIRIRPTTFDITFQVMDIQPTYIPASLHQKFKFIVTNGFELNKGLGRRLNGIANPVAIQENLGRARLNYRGVPRKAKSGWKVQSKQQARTSLYRYFTSGGIMTPKHVAMVEDQPMELAEWVHTMAQELDNWTTEVLPEPPHLKHIFFYFLLKCETFPQINNAALVPDDADKSSRQDEGEETEEEALKELESKGEETREIRIGKLIPPDFKRGLTELLREYEDIFAWSYRDMLGLDAAIVEHRLPLIPNAIPIWQQLRRMKPKVEK